MKIFMTGATGYIGGSVARALVDHGHQVSGLVRSENKAEALRAFGVEPVIGSLDDADTLCEAACQADAVIHTASADHAGAVMALVTALERSGKLFIHTSGSSIVVDTADGEYAAEVALDEASHFEPVPYRRARVDLNRYVRQAAIEKGMRSVVICPAMIYGEGRGLQPDSDQIPKLLALARQIGAGVYFGKGLNHYSNVHIDDLVDLYLLAIDRAPGGSFFFAENGHASFREIAEMASHALGFGGQTVSMCVEDLTRQYGNSARFGVASNSLVRAENARRLGWSPKGPALAEYFAGIAKSH